MLFSIVAHWTSLRAQNWFYFQRSETVHYSVAIINLQNYLVYAVAATKKRGVGPMR